MAASTLSHDPLWPRAGGWPAPTPGEWADLVLVGVPTHTRSLSPTQAHRTPAAVREALRRYSGHSVAATDPRRRGAAAEVDVTAALRIRDAGDLPDPDTAEGERAATARIGELAASARLTVVLGGDNAATVPGALGVYGAHITTAGLVTIDAHHDVRDGDSNGSPVRRLVEAGLDPRRIVQLGIGDFANSAAYRRRVREWGVTVVHRDELSLRPARDVVAEALAVAGAAGGPVYVDVDVDVCDRSVAPACPASVPGGLAAHELRALVRRLARDPRVAGMDVVEVDAAADASDGRTVRLAALLVLEAATGLALR